MLESLILENFQTHEYKEVDLSHPIINLAGPSDHGKSAVIRAARWLTLNKPSGTGFIRHGADRCRVALKVDGRTIERIRSKTDNLYILDGQEYKVPGTGVPDDIASVLEMDSLNFNLQHDPVFWFSLSPGEVSRQLNSIVALDLIDSTLSRIAQDARRAKTETDVCLERLDAARVRRDALEWILEADTDLRRIEALESTVQENREKVDSLRNLLGEITEVDNIIRRAEDALEYGEVAVEAMESCIRLQDRQESLRSLLSSYSEAEEEAQRLTEEAERVEEELRGMTKGMCPICGKPMKGKV